MSKVNKKLLIVLVIMVVIILGVYFYYSLKNNQSEVKNNLLEPMARIIAEKTCIKGGESLAPGYYNEGTKTWWFDANLNAIKAGCNPACVVNTETKTAEINWRCNGLTPDNSRSEIYCQDEQRNSELCATIYQPVCATVEIQCIMAPCNPIKETFSNSCEACRNGLVKSYTSGACDNTVSAESLIK